MGIRELVYREHVGPPRPDMGSVEDAAWYACQREVVWAIISDVDMLARGWVRLINRLQKSASDVSLLCTDALRALEAGDPSYSDKAALVVKRHRRLAYYAQSVAVYPRVSGQRVVEFARDDLEITDGPIKSLREELLSYLSLNGERFFGEVRVTESSRLNIPDAVVYGVKSGDLVVISADPAYRRVAEVLPDEITVYGGSLPTGRRNVAIRSAALADMREQQGRVPRLLLDNSAALEQELEVTGASTFPAMRALTYLTKYATDVRNYAQEYPVQVPPSSGAVFDEILRRLKRQGFDRAATYLSLGYVDLLMEMSSTEASLLSHIVQEAGALTLFLEE